MPEQPSDEGLDLVARHAPAMFPGATVDVAARTLLVPVPEGRARLNLDPLLAEVARAAPPAREEVVRRWLASMVPQVAALADQPDPLQTPPTRPDELRLQVMPGWDLAEIAPLVSTPVGRTFDALVVYPDPHGRPAYLPRSVADAHFGGAEAAVELALQQTIAELAPALQIEDAVLDGHLVRRLALPGYPFVPVVLVSLDRFLPGPARGGTIVLVPGHDEVFLSSVDTRADLDAVPMLGRLAADRYAGSDLPFSSDVYHYDDSTYHLVELDPDGTSVFPDELAAVLAALR